MTDSVVLPAVLIALALAGAVEALRCLADHLLGSALVYALLAAGLGGAAMLASVAAASAQAQPASLVADHPEIGWIRLRVTGAEGSSVTLAEQTAAGRQPVAEVKLVGGQAVVRHAEIWRCDSYVRRFVATVAAPDGTSETATADVRTPSCRKRLKLAAGVAKRGRSRRVVVRVADRWRVGDVSARLCTAAPGGRITCRTARILGGRSELLLTYSARGAGIWTVALQTSWKQVEIARTYVRPARKLRVLATGDSMIQFVDLDLKKRLGRKGFKVRSESRISTGISKPFLLNWPNQAKRQARRLKPDLTVMFIGANDGFPFGDTDCCGDAWVDAYAARVESMVTSYSRKGRGLVYWLALPAPRPAQWRSIYPAVNRALRRAAAALPGQMRLIELDKVFTPGFRFRQTMVWHGKRLNVRQGDGIHLSVAGAAIAEALIERALRLDGVIR